jgi:hypothetical protein
MKILLKCLNIGSRIKELWMWCLQMKQLKIHDHILQLKKHSKYQDPKSLIPFGQKIYSQHEEDGMLREIFNRIGSTNKTFVEFGAGNGLENNTVALLHDGWSGLWIDGSESNIAAIKKNLNHPKLAVEKAFITKENINTLISTHIKTKEIDLLSVDIDGNDLHIIEAITCVDARVIVVEYNAKFPPPIRFCVDYDPKYIRPGISDCFGVSLQSLDDYLSTVGYVLVGCCLMGTNAFFVKKDCAKSLFQKPYTTKFHYEPPRLYLDGQQNFHHSSFKTLSYSA